MLWLRTGLFTLLVPGTVLVLVPVALLATGLGPTLSLGPARWVGLVPLALGLGMIHYVRNPQYVGVLLVAVGEAMLAEAVVLLGYAAVLAIAYHLFVRYYEEPTLAGLFGEAYSRYREAVPRWLPS
jgi:protein-S-isoprenylcysteine O-methyltransferase Ste14